MSVQYTPSQSSLQIAKLPSLAFDHRRDLPPIPALYFVLDQHVSVLYIGQTANLRDRWKSHHRAPQMSDNAHRIHWREIADDRQRAEAERQSIAFFRPPWNRSEIPVAELKRVESYINDVARYMEIDPRDLVCRILADWAYNRADGRV